MATQQFAQTVEHTAEQDFIIQAAYEAAFLPEHEIAEQGELVADLIDELATAGGIDLERRENLLALFDSTMRIAQGQRSKNVEPTVPVVVDMSKIDWVQAEAEATLPAELVTTPQLTYRLVDLTGLNGVTRGCMDKLSQQTKGGEPVLPKLLSTLKNTALPILYEGIMSGQHLRPLTRHGGKKGTDKTGTDYPAYKIGVQGTNNRAVLLLLDNGSEGPVFGLAALYVHEDGASALRAIE